MFKNEIDLGPLAQVVDGKVILITGASSGIGLSISKILAPLPCKVLMVSRNKKKLDKALSEVLELGEGVHSVPCDLSQEDEVSRLVKDLSKEYGAIDVLINNAGHSIRRSIVDSYDRLHDFKRTMDVNYFGAMGLMLGFLPGMQEKGQGHVINVLTMGVQFRTPGFAAYIASKSALDAATKCIASELKNRGIRFSQVYMPLVNTPMIRPTKIYKDLKALTPEQAAELVLKSLITKESKVTLPLGILAEIFHTFLPDRSLKLMNEFFRKEKKQEKKLRGKKKAGPEKEPAL